MESVTVGFVSVMPAGKEITATAPLAQTPACPALGCFAADWDTASVGFVSAPSQGRTELPVKNAPPVLTPAQSKSEFYVFFNPDLTKKEPSFSQSLARFNLKSHRLLNSKCNIPLLDYFEKYYCIFLISASYGVQLKEKI